MSKRKNRNGKQHIKHACRRFEPSEIQVKYRKYIDCVLLDGLSKKRAAELIGLKYDPQILMPSKEVWESLPEKGQGSKYSCIHFSTSLKTLKHSRYRTIYNDFIAQLCPQTKEYEQIIENLTSMLSQKNQELEELKQHVRDFRIFINSI